MKYTDAEWRCQAAACLRAWRRTKSVTKAAKTVGISRVHFWRTLEKVPGLRIFFKNYRGRGVISRSDWVYVKGWGKKFKAIGLLGGRCIECGNTDFVTLEFHHHASNKEVNVATLRLTSWDLFWKEACKCELLCCNCHRRKHVDLERFQRP